MEKIIILLLQLPIPSPSDIEKFSKIKDVSVIGLLMLGLGYFIWENYRLKKDLSKAIEERVKDLKESKQYSEVVMQQFNNLANDLKDMIRGNK